MRKYLFTKSHLNMTSAYVGLSAWIACSSTDADALKPPQSSGWASFA